MIYHVSPTGNDSNKGTEFEPFLSIQKAANLVEPGSTVIVHPGDYQGFLIGWAYAPSWTEDGPIRFIAMPGVNITRQNSKTKDGICIENCNWVEVSGFRVAGMGRAGIRLANCKHAMIKSNICISNAVWGIYTSFCDDVLIENNQAAFSLKEHGIYHANSGDRPIIRGNNVYSNKGSGIHMNGDVRQLGGDGNISGALIEGNVIFDNSQSGHGSGLNCDGVDTSIIKGNLIYENRSSGISLFRSNAKNPSVNNVVSFNTIVNAAVSKKAALNIRDGSTGNRIYNNILLTRQAKNPTAISISDDCLDGFKSDFNILSPSVNTWTSIAAWRDLSRQDLDSILSNPDMVGFINPGIGDYRLRPDSIAVRAGKQPDIGAMQTPLIEEKEDDVTKPRTRGNDA